MGQEKYRLSSGGETLLQRICRIVQPEVSRILIVAAVNQQIPQSESNTKVLRSEPSCKPVSE
jgi:molybdopterin-guanine dinucleotide biosynthesis protein A